MATAKKKAPAKRKTPGAKKELNASPASKAAGHAPAHASGGTHAGHAAHAKPGNKGLVIAAVMFCALALLGLQIFTMAKHQASLKLNMFHTGKNIQPGMADGQCLSPQGLQGDKDDNLYFLEGMGPDQPRLQKFNSNADFVGIYKPKKATEMLTGAQDIDVDADGNPYVLLKNGEIRVLDKDMKFVKTIKTGVNGPSAIGIGPDGKIYVASQSENKVVMLNQAGIRAGEFGAPGTKTGDLATPVRMRVTQDGLIAVMELGSTGLHMKVFTPDLKLKTQFDLTKLPWCEPLKLGVTSDDKMFCNDQVGGRSLVIYDLKTGDFLGESQGTNDNQLFISPGGCGADKYTQTVFIHSANGLTRCRMPLPGDKK